MGAGRGARRCRGMMVPPSGKKRDRTHQWDAAASVLRANPGEGKLVISGQAARCNQPLNQERRNQSGARGHTSAGRQDFLAFPTVPPRPGRRSAQSSVNRSYKPVAIEATVEVTKRSKLSMERVV